MDKQLDKNSLCGEICDILVDFLPDSQVNAVADRLTRLAGEYAAGEVAKARLEVMKNFKAV